MISWLEVSSGVIAKAEAAEVRLKITAMGRSMPTFFNRLFEFCHAGIAVVAREFSKLIFDQRPPKEERNRPSGLRIKTALSIGAIAVVISLIYLASEVRSNTPATRKGKY